MKKLAIAASSVALAAMPVVGVFAEGNTAATQGATTDDMVITDILQITVEDTCTFSAVTGGASTGTFDTTYAATVANGAVAQFQVGEGQAATDKSDHVFGVVCNNDDGWAVSATAPAALADSNVDSKHNIAYAAAALPTANSQPEGKWNAVLSGAPVDTAYAVENQTGITAASGIKYISINGGVIARENDSTDGSTFTVTYGAYVGTETPAGTYTATSTTGDGDNTTGSNGSNSNDGQGTIDYVLSVL